MAPKAAQGKLEKQIDLLGELRNAGTRAVEFREWRQTTLTLIERIWPDQATRATRFRRIPFSPTSANADDKVMREAFERGCAEARRLLKLWLAEIGSRGVTQEAEAPRLAEAVRQTLVEMQPPKQAQRPAAVNARAKPEPKPAPKPGPRPTKRARRALPAEREVERPDRPASHPALPPEFEAAAGAAAPPTADMLADALAQSIDHALERARREVRNMRTPDEPMDPKGRSYSPAPVGENRTLVSYVARAFIGLAGDVEELGVPEGHCERVRLALLDLAHHLDTGSVTWALMRDAVTLVMHYPALGRQALPLLLPYLENAA
jgi:hypothetical protein